MVTLIVVEKFAAESGSTLFLTALRKSSHEPSVPEVGDYYM
jgi:hypothetical protein